MSVIMRKYVLSVFVFLQFLSLFAASVPKWVSDVDSEFPKEKYIARLGSGNTVENARTDALGQIAGFFKSEVVAYIERAQGWQAIETQTMQLQSKYESFLELAQKTDDATMKYKYLTKAKAAGEDVLSALYMGFLFEPAKKKEYKNCIAELSLNYDLTLLQMKRDKTTPSQKSFCQTA